MLPLGHAAFAYLCYVGYGVVGDRRLPAGFALVSLLAGSQFPDLIDKPLTYWDLLPYGRSFAHSIFVLVAVGLLVRVVVRRWDAVWRQSERPELYRIVSPVAFLVGYGSHLLGDAYGAVLAADYAGAAFLFYPLFPLPASASDVAPWLRLRRIYLNMGTHPQAELIVAALVVFAGIRLHAHRERIKLWLPTTEK